MLWRPMLAGDTAGVADLANAVHLSYPEDPKVFEDRLSVYPQGCYILEDGKVPKGLLLSHPWLRRAIPGLNSTLGSLPERPDCFYLHDLALDESVRGQGHALSAVEIVFGLARSGGLSTILLMAVGNAHKFWEHVGFHRYESYEMDPAEGYGPEAAAYILELPM